MSKKTDNLDKFYTQPSIARRFVDVVNSITSLSSYDLIIEPSAGSGNILQYLPAEYSIGLDIAPEGPNIRPCDFFTYSPPQTAQSILCIGNPPFGSGYMNPMAKQFFNYAAKWSRTIAFIVPAKWHTSWKVHYQLNPLYQLLHSELLPKYSFVRQGGDYDVNCCMQVWCRNTLFEQVPNLPNLRITERPSTIHPDFEMFLTCDNVPRLPQVREQLRNREYWDFGLRYWGKIEVVDIEAISPDTTTHVLIKTRTPLVRSIFEHIDWQPYIVNMGAPNVGGKSLIVKAYEHTKQSLYTSHQAFSTTATAPNKKNVVTSNTTPIDALV